MAILVLPRVQAMVLCDAIEESEDEQGVFHLNGVRSTMDAPSFAAVCPRLCVFVQMSGHPGDPFCHVKIEHLGSGELIHRTKPKPIHFDNPASVVPVLFRLRNCVFPSGGLYYVQVFHESKLIAERPLHLRKEQ